MLGIYTRVSTDDQKINGISLENQVARGKELALRLGCKYKVFSDPGMSGTIPFNERPGLLSLINEMVDGKIQILFATDLDRISRNSIDSLTIKNLIKASKTKFYDLRGEIDLLDINQDLLVNIRLSLAEYEALRTGMRIKEVLERNVINGKVLGGPLIAFGYTKDENKMMIIDKGEAEIVKLIYKLSLEGNGTKMIASILNEKKIPTKRGRTKTGNTLLVKGEKKTHFIWRDAVVYKILTNPIYMGVRMYKEKKYTCPAIVDENTFMLVKEKLSKRNYFKNTTNKYDYLLKGLIICPVCKGRFFGHKRENGKDNAYVCNSKRYGGEFCGNRGISIDYLDNLVIENMNNLLKITNDAFDYSETDESIKAKKSTLIMFKKLLIETESRINNLLDMVEVAKVNPSTFKSRFHNLNQEKIKQKKVIETTEKELGVLSQKEIVVEFVKNVVKDFRKMKTIDEKKQIIQNTISKITIRWNHEEARHMIGIFFRLDKLNKYLLSKELIIDRNKRQKGKTYPIVISEKIMISNAIGFSDEDISLIRYS